MKRRAGKLKTFTTSFLFAFLLLFIPFLFFTVQRDSV